MLVAAATLRAADAGCLRHRFWGHGFRRGGAALAAAAEVPDVLIERQGDWASQVYREYVQLTHGYGVARDWRVARL